MQALEGEYQQQKQIIKLDNTASGINRILKKIAASFGQPGGHMQWATKPTIAVV